HLAALATRLRRVLAGNPLEQAWQVVARTRGRRPVAAQVTAVGRVADDGVGELGIVEEQLAALAPEDVGQLGAGETGVHVEDGGTELV
ncbi:hypothetical protein DF186_17925, partial [Enterococcus hirae]